MIEQTHIATCPRCGHAGVAIGDDTARCEPCRLSWFPAGAATRDQTVPRHEQEHLFNAPSTMPGQLALPGAS